MATYKNSTSKGSMLSSTPMQLTNGELFRYLSNGANSGVASSSAATGGKSSSGGRSSRSGGGGGYAEIGYAAPAVDQTARFTGLYDELKRTTFSESGVSYTPVTESQLSEQIAAWLLPGYEQAIAERQEKTKGYAAELDADAIARGMGASTYVTDVKSRQQRDEARDIAVLRSEYGATLAKNVAERMNEEKDRALEADMFNAEAKQAAYKLAYEAAVFLMGLGAVAHETEDEEEA